MNTTLRTSAVLVTTILAGCSTTLLPIPPATSAQEYLADLRQSMQIHPDASSAIENDVARVEKGFPIRVGMTVEQVESIVTNDAQKAGTDSSSFAFQKLNSPTGSLTYLLYGECGLLVDIGLKSNRVENIYVIAGRPGVLFPPGYCYAGNGPHVGAWAEAIKQMIIRNM